MASPVEKAQAAFDRSFNCAQSVFSVFAAQYGLGERTALRLASPFGGGMARQGEICGAVTGGLLTLGLARGAETPAQKEEIYKLAQEFMRRFKSKHAALRCRDLIGIDISTPEGWQQARESGQLKTICPELVRDAVEMLQEMLEKR